MKCLWLVVSFGSKFKRRQVRYGGPSTAGKFHFFSRVPYQLIAFPNGISLVLSNWSQKYPMLPWNKWARVFFLANPWKAFIINKLQDKLQEDQVELAQRRTLHCYSRNTFFLPLHTQDDVIKSSYLVKPTHHYFWFTNPHALLSYKMLQILLALFHRLNISLKKKKKKNST